MQVGERCKIVGDTWVADDPVPAATWYDDALQHFVSLLERRHNNEPSLALADLIEYRLLSREQSGVMRPGRLLRFRLPQSLSVEERRAPSGEVVHSRRIPLVSKLSLDQKLIAMQFSSTLLRIVPLEDDKHSKHWTIDILEHKIMYSTAHDVPTPRYKTHASFSCNDCHVLPNGIIWSDHGGNSQDLVVVTSKAVMCYKISLLRNQMAATHSFSHPSASTVWWEPISRTVMVGSYGPANECHNVTDKNFKAKVLQLRTFLLRFSISRKSKRLPRLELPPPKRLPPFGVGILSLLDLTLSVKRVVTPADVGVVNLYGAPFAIEFGIDAGRLQISFVRLDPVLGGTLFKRYVIEEVRPTETDMKTIVRSVLDNIFCVSLRQTSRNVFIDIEDYENFYFLDELDETLSNLANPNISSASPCLLLDPPGHGSVIPITLDIDKLSTTLPSTPFFLRRASPKSHAIALSKFADCLRLPSARERRYSIESVVHCYAMDHSAVTWDWKASLPLIYKSSFLPPGAELRQHHLDMDVPSRYPIMAAHYHSSILTQTEILSEIILPKALEALDSPSQKDIGFVLDVAIALLGSLDRHESPPCPALECFIFATMWRLGYAQELKTFLQSRSLTIRSNRYHMRIPAGIVNMGTAVLANAMLAITEEVEFGYNVLRVGQNHSQRAQARRMRQLVLSETHRLVSCRVSDSRILIKHLLSRRWNLCEAIHICSSHSFPCLDGSLDEKDGPIIRLAIYGMDGESFLRAALDVAKSQNDVIDRYRVLRCLSSFLSRWDPDCLDPKRRQTRKLVGHRQSFDDSTLGGNRVRLKNWSRYIERRPSTRSFRLISKWQDDNPLRLEGGSDQSSLAISFESELDTLLGKRDAELSRHVRTLLSSHTS